MKSLLSTWKLPWFLQKPLLLVALPLISSLYAQDANVGARHDRPPAEHHRSILVTGASEIFATPDHALIRFGMTAQNSRATIAQSKVNEVIQKAIKGIEKAGVDRHFVHSAGISLTPVYSEKILSSGASKISAFRADNMLEVEIRDIKLIGDVLDAAIDAGANEVQGVFFRLKNDDAQRHTALAAASEQAKAKAQTIAKALDFQLGDVLEANETSAQFPITVETAGASFFRMARPAVSAPTPVEPGQIRIEATITVRYEIRGKTAN